MNRPEPDPSLCVLYDGDCPLCSREIGWYQKLDANERIRWIDLRDTAASPLPAGIGRDTALARFHVVQADGAVASGAAAFVRLWQAYPGLRLAARLFSKPLPLAILERAYRLFLPLRPALARLLPRRTRPTSNITETHHDE